MKNFSGNWEWISSFINDCQRSTLNQLSDILVTLMLVTDVCDAMSSTLLSSLYKQKNWSMNEKALLIFIKNFIKILIGCKIIKPLLSNRQPAFGILSVSRVMHNAKSLIRVFISSFIRFSYTVFYDIFSSTQPSDRQFLNTSRIIRLVLCQDYPVNMTFS